MKFFHLAAAVLLPIAVPWAATAQQNDADQASLNEALAGAKKVTLGGGSDGGLRLKFELRYRFEPGEIIRTEVSHRMAVDTTIQGNNQQVSTRSSSVKHWKVTNVDSSGAITFVHSVESIDMWQHFKGRAEIHFNSRTDREAPPGYEEVAKSVGVPLTVITMDSRGKILKREEKSAQSKYDTSQMTIVLPTKSVAVGDTWSNPLDLKVELQENRSIKNIQCRQQFTLEKIDGTLATIRMDSQILTPVNNPQIEVQLVQRLPQGTIVFDMDRGRIVSQQIDIERRVVGFAGAASSAHYLIRLNEKLLGEGEQAPEILEETEEPAKLQEPSSAPEEPDSTQP